MEESGHSWSTHIIGVMTIPAQKMFDSAMVLGSSSTLVYSAKSMLSIGYGF